MEPEFASLTENERRVRFEAGVPSSLRNERVFNDKEQGHSEETTPSQRIRPQIPPDTPSPLRISGGPSVKGAAGRFSGDGDHSLMLPNPTLSPHQHIPKFLPDDAHSEDEEESIPSSSKDKGKARALDWEFNFADMDASGEMRVRGMERELYEAREEQRRKELEDEFDINQSILMEERERDRERIRMLEEEVARLKSQVSQVLFHVLYDHIAHTRDSWRNAEMPIHLLARQ